MTVTASRVGARRPGADAQPAPCDWCGAPLPPAWFEVGPCGPGMTCCQACKDLRSVAAARHAKAAHGIDRLPRCERFTLCPRCQRDVRS